MPRPKPKISTELRYLRLVMTQDWDDDKKDDVELSHYRQRMLDDPKWVLQQRRAAEKEHRDELAAWAVEVEREEAARLASQQATQQAAEIPNDPCDIVIEKLLNEWDALKV